ncbi:hypothetical protein AAA799E16_01026 [Marine Group I thaumarchaeote SCGC AAA799-E16]|uniref:Uncharacterized protein n=5 Tax=Marine Group I TaxID=905826 RepID=A0A087S9D5_9ARCH|nr:hypothetical protein AAA799E16_01026 [Marine Group I thaumarchaeote SCGC AAA799-E16]KFM16522.1 hypothetical protein AAA799D11_00646 [Marine Group I thaumarchaeote SCGC AAA799-D11]KFM18551.1 hypothetical protein SCCGRSA3_01086 [Marine Group I thaumarchaeote SCGC RSA3]KFM19000.1 hypothetical protein AAA799P11_00852 [Marine Group I thaumarchaeote SCGC AAA799-P11]KFM22339.1 hypothetical protein AAA799B03_00089 [Marine Group I thaumarchaeote SCGC AAA799-B03]
MTNTIKLVFLNTKYVALSFVIFVPMLIGLLILSEYIFLEPYVVSHLPRGTELGFLLIVIISALAALVLPMNVFRISVLKGSTQKMGGGVIGSFVGAAAGACSCGPIGFAVISTFGSVGATATAFLTNYEIPLRIIAIGVLVITYFTTVKSLKTECKFEP